VPTVTARRVVFQARPAKLVPAEVIWIECVPSRAKAVDDAIVGVVVPEAAQSPTPDSTLSSA
jgi:hypothetical protein